MRTVTRQLTSYILCVFLVCVVSPSWGSLNRSLSPWRDAKSRLKEDIVAHRAAKHKLSPGDNSAVTLTFTVWPFQVLKMDEVEQSVTTVSYVEVYWQDEDLAWNASDYENITKMGLDHDELWHPNLIVINSADEDIVTIQDYSDRLLIANDGTILLRTPTILRTTCDLDFTNYPFDFQKCDIIILPFFDDCNFQLNTSNLTELPNPFHLHGEWEIIRRAVLSDFYNISGQSIPIVRVRLLLKRGYVFYVICILLPLAVTSLMTSLVFWIPPSSGEKISYLVSIFVSAAVFLNFIADTMPRKVTYLPLITMFIISVMTQCVIALLVTLFVIRRYDEEVLEATQDSDNAISEQIENILAWQGPEHIPEALTKPDKTTPECEKPAGILFGTGKSYSERLILAMSTLLQRKGKTVKPAGKTSNKGRGRRRKCRCCIKSRHWDCIFFFMFVGGTLAFYAKVLYPVYSERFEIQNSEIYTF